MFFYCFVIKKKIIDSFTFSLKPSMMLFILGLNISGMEARPKGAHVGQTVPNGVPKDALNSLLDQVSFGSSQNLHLFLT